MTITTLTIVALWLYAIGYVVSMSALSNTAMTRSRRIVLSVANLLWPVMWSGAMVWGAICALADTASAWARKFFVKKVL